MLQEHCRFIVDVCSGAPVALAVVCNLMRYGHCDAAEFIRLYSDPKLPLERSISNTNSTSYLPFQSRATSEQLQRWVDLLGSVAPRCVLVPASCAKGGKSQAPIAGILGCRQKHNMQ